jgi:hypothetical protein
MNLHPIPPDTTNPPRAGSNFAMHMTTPLYYGTGSILGVDLEYDGSSIYGTYNASAYNGIQFWAHGTFTDSATNLTLVDVWVACAATTSTAYGGNCTLADSCYDNRYRIQLGSDWALYQVPFGALSGGIGTFDQTTLTHIQFRPAGTITTAVDLWVDDLAFY